MKQSEKSAMKVKHQSYQPSRAEFRDDSVIPTTPEQLAKSVVKDIAVSEIKNYDFCVQYPKVQLVEGRDQTCVRILAPCICFVQFVQNLTSVNTRSSQLKLG